jgi:hypothetical protein
MRISAPPPVIDQSAACAAVRAAVAFLGFHEQDLVAGGVEDFDGLGQRRRINPVFGIHEQLAAVLDGCAQLRHLGHDVLVHRLLAHMLADWRRIAGTAEIAGERLLADHVLSGPHRIDDHLRMQRRRRADIDDVDRRIGEQRAIVTVGARDLMLLGERLDLIAARDRGHDLGVDAINALIGIHMQFGDEACTDESDPDLGHAGAACLVTRAGRH